MKSQKVLTTSVVLSSIIVAIVALAVVFYLRKTNTPIKIGENKK
jgi:hypothetical protein